MKSLLVGSLVLLSIHFCFGEECTKEGFLNKCAQLVDLIDKFADLDKRVEELEQPKATSCKELYDRGEREDKAYELHVGSKTVSVYCHMSAIVNCGSGGFTLVMKTDGNKPTFKYDSVLWTNDESYNLAAGATGFDRRETKLPTYSSTSFNKVCIGMNDRGRNRFISVTVSAHSLHDLIAPGEYHKTSLGRNAWKSLLASPSLQRNCNMEGFNVKPPTSLKARIGIISNQENNCNTCDSFVAIGSNGAQTTGNLAAWSPDNGNRKTATIGYVLVQ